MAWIKHNRETLSFASRQLFYLTMSSDQQTVMKSPTRSTARSVVIRPSAMTMQRELEQSTKALEIEKRRHLQLQEEYQKTQRLFEEEKEQLNVLLRQTNSNSIVSLPIKATNMLHSSNKLHSENEAVLARIRELRDEITVLRRERQKHISLSEKLNGDLQQLEGSIQQTDARIDSVRQSNDFVKMEILGYRNRTINDIKDFKQSFGNLSQNYFSERKIMESHLKKSRSSQPGEIQTNALPLLKERLRKLISRNREKIRIVSDYKRACTEVAKMFDLMREYKGKDDIAFIAKELVEKENTIYKLEEYIDQLEARLEATRGKQTGLLGETGTIGDQLNKVHGRLKARRSKKEAAELLKREIADVDKEIASIDKGFEEHAPAIQRALIALRSSHFNLQKDSPEQVRISFSLLRSNMVAVLGELEKYIVLVKPPSCIGAVSSPLRATYDDEQLEHEKDKSEKLHMPSPQDDTDNFKNELLNYNRLRELAADVIGRRGSLPETRKR